MRFGRKSVMHVALTLALLAALFAMAGHAALSERGRGGRAGLVARLGLTDLCVFTEARYTRHPVMADRASAFQDHPLSFEHFPSGSLMGPPPHLRAQAGDE